MYLIGSACKGHGCAVAHSSHQHDAGAAGYPPYRHEGKIRGQSLFFTPVLFPRAVSLSRNTRDQTVTAAPLQLRGVKGQSVCSGRRLRGVRLETPGEARLFISTEPSVGGRRGVLPAHSAVVWATNCTGRKNITQPPRHCVRRKGNHGNRAKRLRNRAGWRKEECGTILGGCKQRVCECLCSDKDFISSVSDTGGSY